MIILVNDKEITPEELKELQKNKALRLKLEETTAEKQVYKILQKLEEHN
jgi:hypothetical protein